MDRAKIIHLAHAHHPIAAPVSAASARSLLQRLSVPEGGRVLDLGCGQGQWLVMLLQDRPDLTAVGVDTSQFALAAAREASDAQGLGDRVGWHLADAASRTHDEKYDAILSVGASHVLGGLRQTLQSLHAIATPTGSALLGDGFWELPPSAAAQHALQMTEHDMPDLVGLVDQVLAAGWLPVAGHTSTADEWDHYEWSWTGSLTQWASQQPWDDRDAQQALAAAAAHWTAWLGGYRHHYGFLTLALAKARQLHD